MRTNRLVVLAVAVAAVAATALTAGPSSADETTIGYTPLRTSWDDAEPGLTSNAVTQPDFGQLWSSTIDGGSTASAPNQIYTQPLVVGGLVIVASEENVVEAVHATTGVKAWSRTDLGAPWTPFAGCGDLVPHVGITATPVYDPATNLVYVLSKVQAAGSTAVIKMHALSPTTGAEAPGWPLTISGSSTNSNEPFNATTANPRPGLLLLDGGIYFATASHCDKGPYVGFVGHVTTGAHPSLRLWSSESGAATNEAGIWQSGGGLMSDGTGRIFVATGNGVSPSKAKGSNPPSTLGESVVRLAVNADGSMSAKDFFSPANNAALDQDDADLGSGGPVALPDSFGSAAHPHLLVVAGKQGVVYLLDRNDLGGMGQGTGGGDDVVSTITGNGVWGRAAAFDGGAGNHFIYLLPSSAPLEAIKVTPNAGGTPTMSVAATSPQSFGFTSGSPVVTSDGGNAATALVWIVKVDGATGTNGRLQAYPAVPPASGPWTPVVDYPLGAMAKFIQPATDGNRVYLGTRDGRVLAFGAPTTGALTASPFTFPSQPVGSTEHGTVTLTAHTDVTITGIATTPGPTFTNDAPTPVVGTALHQGDTVTVPVTFDAQTVGMSSGTLSVTATTAAGQVVFPFSLSGTATQDGALASPASLAFGNIAVGQGKQITVLIQNTGTTAEHITGITAPGAPYSLVSPPAVGFTLQPLASVPVTVQFSPTAATESDTQLQVTTDAASHNVVTVPITGKGFVGSPALTYAPTSLAFGQVAPGATATMTFTLTNTGTSTMKINKAAVPSSPFVVPSPISEGLQVEPDDNLTVTVKVHPLTATPRIDHYSVTINDGKGPHLLTISVNTAPPAGLIPGATGCVTDYRRLRVAGTPIISMPCDNTSAQRWRYQANHGIQLTATGDGYFCLDVPKGSKKPGTALLLELCNASDEQAFVPDAAGRLVNLRSKLCLDVRNHSSSPGTALVVTTCGSAPSQRWDISQLLTTRGELSSGLGSSGQYCLSDPHNTRQNGIPAVLDPCTGAPGQVITRIGSTWRAATQCLTMTKKTAGSPVRFRRCSGSPTQVFTTASNGRLYNPASKLCLAVPGSSTRTGVQLKGYKCTGSAAQRWSRPR